jgi:hypothetical protein
MQALIPTPRAPGNVLFWKKAAKKALCDWQVASELQDAKQMIALGREFKRLEWQIIVSDFMDIAIALGTDATEVRLVVNQAGHARARVLINDPSINDAGAKVLNAFLNELGATDMLRVSFSVL